MSLTAAAYQHYREHGGVADLSTRAKLRLTGADRIRYLNGQVTANVTRLPAGRALPACITTAKGKLSADAFVSALPLGDDPTAAPTALLVDAEPELREGLLARLERYIIADDVTLEDVSDELTLLHFLPPPGTPSLSLAPLYPGAIVRQASRFGREGCDVWMPTAACLAAAESLPLLSADLLELLRIEAGVPRWGRELDENTLPPEAGLDRTHIDYHKGCYIGQEVISRVKSVGHVNRQLNGFCSVQGEPLAAGLRLFALEEPGKLLGTLTSVAWSFALAKPIALGYLKRGSTSPLLARPALGEEPALEVAVCELPFFAP